MGCAAECPVVLRRSTSQASTACTCWCAAAGVLPLVCCRLPPAPNTLCKPVQLPPRPQAAQQLVQEQAPCADQAKAFADCMAWSEGDMGACQEYFDLMQSCRRAVVNQQQ